MIALKHNAVLKSHFSIFPKSMFSLGKYDGTYTSLRRRNPIISIITTKSMAKMPERVLGNKYAFTFVTLLGTVVVLCVEVETVAARVLDSL